MRRRLRNRSGLSIWGLGKGTEVKTLLEPYPVVAGGVERKLRLSGIAGQSIVDGPGLRMTVFAQGCVHGCVGCHNPATHGFGGGFEVGIEELLARFDENPLLAGVTLSGGEPLLQAGAFLPLARAIRARGKTVWCFTGYVFEELLEMVGNGGGELRELLGCIDVLVDGRYEVGLRSLELLYRGSSNQRVLDLARSLKSGVAVEWVKGVGSLTRAGRVSGRMSARMAAGGGELSRARSAG